MSDWYEKDHKDLRNGCFFILVFSFLFWASILWVFISFLNY